MVVEDRGAFSDALALVAKELFGKKGLDLKSSKPTLKKVGKRGGGDKFGRVKSGSLSPRKSSSVDRELDPIKAAMERARELKIEEADEKLVYGADSLVRLMKTSKVGSAPVV